jgi:ring-1,2-phenylacetyl-CoA epoxidase subunit PaaD
MNVMSGVIEKAIDEKAIMAVLETIPDPEIPVLTITDLGIVRGIVDNPPRVMISPTYTGCPATVAIEMLIREALDNAGFANVYIERVLFPPWTTDWISERGRKRLKAYGIAPPDPSAKTQCPLCGSRDTDEVSRFGSTPCKAQWRCNSCLEPFERFKCH